MLLRRITLYLALGIGGSLLLYHYLPLNAGQWAAQWINVGLCASFILGVLLLERAAATGDQDSGYLYYLGVSGARMLLYMATIAGVLVLIPSARDMSIILGLTGAFCLYTGMEVSFFLRKLRQILKKSPN